MKTKDPLPEQLISPESPSKAPRKARLRASEVSESKWHKKRIGHLKKICALLAITFIFYLLGKNLYRNFGEISQVSWDIKSELLILSFICLVVNLAVASYAWKKILSLFHTSLPFDQSFKIMSVSATGKYMPGKVWQYLGQIYLGQRAGLPRGVTFFSMILLFLAYNLVGILLFLFSLFFWRMFSPILISAFLAAFLSMFLLTFYPPILNKVLRVLFRLFKKERDGDHKGRIWSDT